MNKRWALPISLAVFVVIISIFIGVIEKTAHNKRIGDNYNNIRRIQQERLAGKNAVSPTIVFENFRPPEDYSDLDEKWEFPSPNGKYVLVLRFGIMDECDIEILKKTGGKINLDQINPSLEIRCADNMGDLDTSFMQWVGDDKMVVDSSGSIFGVNSFDIVDLNTMKITKEKYQKLYNLVAISESLEQRAYKINHDIFIIDKSGSELKRVFLGDDGFTGIHYDNVNHGFFIYYDLINNNATKIAIEKGENVGNGIFNTYFVFINTPNLQVKNLLVTEPSAMFGRGCYSPKIEFSPRKIVVNGSSCFQIDEKYFKNDKLVLNL